MDNGLSEYEEESISFLNPPSASRLEPLELDFDTARPASNGRAHGLRQRKVLQASTAGSTNFIHGFMRGVLRENIGSQYTFRNIFVIFCMAAVLLVALIVLKDQTDGEFDGLKTPAPHSNTFGGKNNPGVQHGSGGHFQRPPKVVDEDLPLSNVGQAVHSLSPLNVENHYGHYRHDPKHSPYASSLYSEDVVTQSEREDIQSKYAKRVQKYTERYGEWENPSFPGKAAQTFYHDYWYKDVEEFPPDSWQMNERYMLQFLHEGMLLIERVREAIYEEYGFGIEDVADTDAMAKIEELRDEFMGIRIGDFIANQDGTTKVDGKPFRGAAYLNKAAWDGLIRKLMHAIMVEDEFYVVVAGPASATYDGVSFSQTQIMQFHDILEPVFDRLGVRLISRNMGMEASTTVSALGGGDLYGEADIFWYRTDPSTKESDMHIDLLLKQMILSGERLPVILSRNVVTLKEDTNNRVWLGNVQPGPMGCNETDIDDMTRIVFPTVKACEYVKCSKFLLDFDGCQPELEYPCWIDRHMPNSTTHEELAQEDSVGSGPFSENYRQHQLEGRKLSLLLLEALSATLLQMIGQQKIVEATTIPSEHWHVGAVYDDIRDTVRRIKKIDANGPQSFGCEMLLEPLDADICHMEMHAYSEWTPRVTPVKNGLASIATNGSFVNEAEDVEQLYDNWFDLLPHNFMPSFSEVDVHLVSILGEDPERRTRRRTQVEAANCHETRNSARALISATGQSNPWRRYGSPIGFCDGSSMSFCNKRRTNKCLLANRNHYQAGMLSRGSSDFLVLDIGEIKEGVVLLRFEWHGKELSVPEDLRFFHSVDGPNGNVTIKSGSEFKESSIELAADLVVYPVMTNKQWSRNKSLFGNVTLSLRFETSQDDFEMLLTHVYFA